MNWPVARLYLKHMLLCLIIRVYLLPLTLLEEPRKSGILLDVWVCQCSEKAWIATHQKRSFL